MNEQYQAPQPQPPQVPNWQRPMGQQQQPPKKPRVGLIITAVIGGLVVLCCGGAGMVALVSGTDSADVSADADAEPSADSEAGTNTDEPKPAKKGEPVRDGSFEFTVTKVRTGVANLGGQYGQDAQGAFTLITVRVKNIGEDAQMLNDFDQIAYADGKKYETDSEAGWYANEGGTDVWLNDINPGNTVTGVLVFDVPKGTKLASVELHDSAFSGGVKVAL